jgi:hypothetical protein
MPRVHPQICGWRPCVIAHKNLSAKAVKGALIYQWQMSSDGGKTWVDLPWTKKSSTSVTGLTAATVYSFRVRVLTAAGTSDWTAVITHIAQ